MKKLAYIFLAVFTLFCFASCAKYQDAQIDYWKDNDFEVQIEDTSDALTYFPKGKDYRYGLIFYVGTGLDVDSYAYLGNALAKQGYLFVVPKTEYNMTYNFYEDRETAFIKYNNISFFVGGHSQGGGAAVLRAQQNESIVSGVVLFAPLCYNDDSLKDTKLKVLFLEGENDKILTDAMKADAKSRMNEKTTYYMIEGGNHMGFSSVNFFADGKLTITLEEMQQQIINYTLDFLKPKRFLKF